MVLDVGRGWHRVDEESDVVLPATRLEHAVSRQLQVALLPVGKELLGDASAYPEIFNANKDQLSDPDKIKPGQVLKIPQSTKH